MTDVDTDQTFNPEDLVFDFDFDDAKITKGTYLFGVSKVAYFESQKDPNKPKFKAARIFCAVKEGPFKGYPAQIFMQLPQKDHEYYRLQLQNFNRFASACAGQELDGPVTLAFVPSAEEGSKEMVLPQFEEAEFWASVDTKVLDTGQTVIEWGKNYSGLLLHDPEQNEEAPF